VEQKGTWGVLGSERIKCSAEVYKLCGKSVHKDGTLGWVYQISVLYLSGSGGYTEVGYVDTYVCGYVGNGGYVDLLLDMWIHTDGRSVTAGC